MSNNNLDDLIVEEIPEKSKGKGILAIFALLVAVLVVAIIMTRMIINGDEENATVVKEPNQEDMISSELQFTPSDHNPKADKKELDQLSSILEDELTNKPPKDSKIPEPNAKTKSNKTEDIKPDTATVNSDDVAEPKVEEPKIDDDVPAEKSIETPHEAKRHEPTPKKHVQKHQRSEAATSRRVAQPSSRGNYYIQVGSFANKPSQQFLSVITRSGFKYKLKAGKLLVGPYGSRAAAQSNLPKVKDRISKGAFIKKL